MLGITGLREASGLHDHNHFNCERKIILLCYITRAPNADANARLKLRLEKNLSRKRDITLSQKWRITSPTGMGSPFDSEQLL